MKGWSCSAENSFAALRAWQTSSKTSLCFLSLAPCVCSTASLQEPGGNCPALGICNVCGTKPLQLQEGQTWHRLAPGPLQRQCPAERICILFEWIFCGSGEMLLCCLSQLSLGEKLAKGSFPLSKDIVQAQVPELTVITQQSFISLISLLLLSSFLPR